MLDLDILSCRNHTELTTHRLTTHKHSKSPKKNKLSHKNTRKFKNRTNKKAIRPHNNENGEKGSTFPSSTRLGEEVGAFHPLSYHPRPKMRRGEGRKSEESSKEKNEQRRMRENGEG